MFIISSNCWLHSSYDTVKYVKYLNNLEFTFSCLDYVVVKLAGFLDDSEFNLTTHESYFMILVEDFTNYILAENTYFTNHTEWTENKIVVLKPTNKCLTEMTF